jgi:hypothetical protein
LARALYAGYAAERMFDPNFREASSIDEIISSQATGAIAANMLNRPGNLLAAKCPSHGLRRPGPVSFSTHFGGLASDTPVEVLLSDVLEEGLLASLKLTDHPAFPPGSVTTWLKMSAGPKFGRFAECDSRSIKIRITPKGPVTWVFTVSLMLNWTGGCSMFIWDSIGPPRPISFLPLGEPLFLSEKESQRDLGLRAPKIRIAFKVPADKGAHVHGVTALTVDAKLGASLQLVGIKFAMKYVTVAGKEASFTLGTAHHPGADDTFVLNWDSVHNLPVDRDLTKPDVTLVATAVATPGSKLWAARETPSASLSVHLD